MTHLVSRIAELPGRARVELVHGRTFGPGGDGHARLNFGTGRRILDQILDAMAASLA